MTSYDQMPLRIVARRTPTRLRLAAMERELELLPDQGVALPPGGPVLFEVVRPDDPGTGNPVLLQPEEMEDADLQELIGRAAAGELHIRMEGVTVFDARRLERLAQLADERDTHVTIELA